MRVRVWLKNQWGRRMHKPHIVNEFEIWKKSLLSKYGATEGTPNWRHNDISPDYITYSTRAFGVNSIYDVGLVREAMRILETELLEGFEENTILVWRMLPQMEVDLYYEIVKIYFRAAWLTEEQWTTSSPTEITPTNTTSSGATYVGIAPSPHTMAERSIQNSGTYTLFPESVVYYPGVNFTNLLTDDEAVFRWFAQQNASAISGS